VFGKGGSGGRGVSRDHGPKKAPSGGKGKSFIGGGRESSGDDLVDHRRGRQGRSEGDPGSLRGEKTPSSAAVEPPRLIWSFRPGGAMFGRNFPLATST